ncbi:hypothetical protein OXX69_004547 [Metschnikowia pulcherrima]
MLKIQLRRNSTAQLVQSQLSARLERYFAETTFQFSKPSHVDELRRVMELVYLRKRPLVAVDVEAYERQPKSITELGIAIYDPENQWLSAQPHIKTVHIISQENKRLLNSQFVPNHKYRFNGGTLKNAVLVGHNLAGDIKWLQSHGVGSGGDTPQVDTQKLFHLSRNRGATLRGILQAVDIPNANLHNAANDAYYTLLAAMCYCDPERRQHFGLDTFVEQKKITDKQRKEAIRKKKFSEAADVSAEDPPTVMFAYPKPARAWEPEL